MAGSNVLVIPGVPKTSKGGSRAPQRGSRAPQVAPTLGTLTIPAPNSATVVVVSQGIDIKASRQLILENWRSYTPAKIVAIIKKYYANIRTAAVQLSHLKAELAALPNSPPPEFLKGIRLSTAEYREIRSAYQAKRQKEGTSVRSVPNVDLIVKQALEYLCSWSPNLIWCGLVVCTGWRPIEILKVAEINMKTQNQHIHQGFWACQSAFAKRSHAIHKYDICRDRPFLAPVWLIERGMQIVRKRWRTAGLTNREINQKYGKHLTQILQRGFPNLVKPTHVLFRRLFAAYSFMYFKEDMPGMSADTFASWVLGHAVLSDQILSYLHLNLQNAGKLDLFLIGKGLEVLPE